MKKHYIIFIMLITVLLSGCNQNAGNSIQITSDEISFTDSIGHEIHIKSPEKTAVLSGSLAEIWTLAGGELYGVTDDAYSDRLFDVPSNAVNFGSVKSPSVETLIAENVDFVILSANLTQHTELYDTLNAAGINTAYFYVESFDDYLNMLKICTDITGRADLYETNGTSIKSQIDAVNESIKEKNQPTVLYLRAFSTGVKAKSTDTVTGDMLASLRCINIADLTPSLLDDLSMEKIIELDPDFIFITTMGEDEEKAMESFDTMFSSNPAWSSLKAVQNDKCIVLPKNLYHYKPNAHWGEAYENLAEILYGT